MENNRSGFECHRREESFLIRNRKNNSGVWGNDKERRWIAILACIVVSSIVLCITDEIEYASFYPFWYNTFDAPDIKSFCISLSGGLHFWYFWILLVVSIGFAMYKNLPLTHISRKSIKDYILEVFLYFVFAFFVLAIVSRIFFSLLFAANRMTLSDTITYTTVIKDKYIWHGAKGHRDYYLIVCIDDLQCCLHTKASAYARSQIGDTVSVDIRKGIIGLPYTGEFYIKYTREK